MTRAVTFTCLEEEGNALEGAILGFDRTTPEPRSSELRTHKTVTHKTVTHETVLALRGQQMVTSGPLEVDYPQPLRAAADLPRGGGRGT